MSLEYSTCKLWVSAGIVLVSCSISRRDYSGSRRLALLMKLKIKQFGSWLIIAVTLAVAGGFLFTGSRSHQLRAAETIEKQYYTCGMDPQIVQDHPGKCPICGMKLRPMEKPLNDKTASAITIDPVTVQNMGFRSEVVGRGPLARTIPQPCTIDFDETQPDRC